MTVKAVLLDVGGVMVAPNPDVLRERLDVDVTDEEAVRAHYVGAAKPDPRVFRPALEVLGVDPADALYVGDMVWADVVGARAAGMRPVHMDPYDFCGAADHDHVRSLSEVANLLEL